MNQEEHLLVCMAEEAVEFATDALKFAKLCQKSLRFGLDSKNPLTDQTNLQALSAEYTDLRAAIELFEEKYLTTIIKDDRVAIEAKKDKIRKHMLIAAEAGKLLFNQDEDNLDLLEITDDMRVKLRLAGINSAVKAMETNIPTFMDIGIESQSELDMMISALVKFDNATSGKSK